MGKKFKKKPPFQMIIQIGMFPRICRYHVTPVQYFTKEEAVTAGERWLKAEGHEVSRKFIHTRHIWRGLNDEPKFPKLDQELTPRNRTTPGVMYWLHEKRTRQQLGQVGEDGKVALF